MQSAELIQKMALWRAKQEAGTLSAEELREAMLAMRAHRTGAQAAGAAKRAAKAPVNVEALKDSLRSLVRK